MGNINIIIQGSPQTHLLLWAFSEMGFLWVTNIYVGAAGGGISIYLLLFHGKKEKKTIPNSTLLGLGQCQHSDRTLALVILGTI